MKQKLFENLGGNTFKLITESVEEINPNAKLVREGLKKVFGSGQKSLSYKRLQGVGLGYIKSVSEAQKTAIQEARILAKEYGYMDDENSQKFVKEDGEMSDFDRSYAENQSTEKREVQIGKELSELAARNGAGGAAGTRLNAWDKVNNLAHELIQMHGQQ